MKKAVENNVEKVVNKSYSDIESDPPSPPPPPPDSPPKKPAGKRKLLKSSAPAAKKITKTIAVDSDSDDMFAKKVVY